jgi:restriction system protein
VNFRMAENSLFAILLRSSWWISAAVAVTFVLIARALLPAEYFAVGVMGAAPFFIIAAIAARKQWQRPSPARIAATVEQVSAMPWPRFADAVEDALRRSGYVVQRAPDPEADFKVTKDGRVAVLACKRWKAARTGVEPLRALQSARDRQDAHDALYVVTGEVSDKALAFAAANRVRIVGSADLTQLLRGAGLPKGH